MIWFKFLRISFYVFLCGKAFLHLWYKIDYICGYRKHGYVVAWPFLHLSLIFTYVTNLFNMCAVLHFSERYI